MSNYSEVLVALKLRPNDIENICKSMKIHDIRLVSNTNGHPSYIKKCVRSLADLDHVIKSYPIAIDIVRLMFKHEPRAEYYLHNSDIYNYSDVVEYYMKDPHQYIADYLNNIGKQIHYICWNNANIKAISMLDPSIVTVEFDYKTAYAKRNKNCDGFYPKFIYKYCNPKNIVRLHNMGYNIKLKSCYNWHYVHYISPDMLEALTTIGLKPKYTEINERLIYA